MSRAVDDVGHVAWAFAALAAFVFLPWWLAAPLVFLPREVEQTVAAYKREKAVELFDGEYTWRDHLTTSWALRKLRDLAGFALGGAAAAAVFL